VAAPAQVLPSWVRFGGELRTRIEDSSGINFEPDHDDTVVLTRIRLDLRLQPVNWLRVYVQGQDARAFLTNKCPIPTTYQDTADLRLLYIDLGDPETSRLSVRAGRQEIVYGDQRLVGYNGWRNTGQAFDAVRLRLRSGRNWVDVFSAGAVEITPGWINHRVPGQNLHGIYGSVDAVKHRATIEPYLFWRLTPRMKTELGAAGNLDQKTTGARVTGTVAGGIEYNTEAAFQFGHLGTDEVRAWGGHWQIGYRASARPFKPLAIMEYNYASGDQNPHDGRRGTFDPPYPSVHDRYGLGDQVGWRNIHHVRGGVEWTLSRQWKMITNLHSYWLASRTDGLYTPSGSLVVRSVSGTAGTDVGREVDISGLWKAKRGLESGAGFARLFPGEFLQRTTPGAGYNFGYMYVDVTF
jgi:hypothetical protein